VIRSTLSGPRRLVRSSQSPRGHRGRRLPSPSGPQGGRIGPPPAGRDPLSDLRQGRPEGP
jgi:hypothetical protein